MTDKSQAFLRVLSGPKRGGVFVLKTLSVFEVGRAEGCQIQIDDPLVALNHARIYRKGSSWIFFDLNSDNGSSINDIKVEKRELVGNEVIRVGHTELMLTFQPPTSGDDGGAGAPAEQVPDPVAEQPSPFGDLTPAEPQFQALPELQPQPLQPQAMQPQAPLQPAPLNPPPMAPPPPPPTAARAATAQTSGYRLVIIDGDPDDRGKELDITTLPRITLGRAGECNFVLADRKVSRCHCIIENRGDGNYVIVDNHGSNGTIVNGEKVTKTVLSNGDYLRLGFTVLAYQIVNAPVQA